MSDLLRSEAAVWKFMVLPWQTAMEMPKGARLIHAHEQAGQVCVWAEVDPAAEPVLRKVLVVPTGNLSTGLTYVGTAHLVEGGQALVLHVYDGGEVQA